MKIQKNYRFWRGLIVGFFALSTITVAILVISPRSKKPQRTVFPEQVKFEAEMIERSIKVPIDDHVFLAHASVNNRGSQTDDYIREVVNSVARYFSALEWPENRPVEVMETDDEIVITWPLSPELEALDAYKPDYTARAFLDKNSKEVRLFVGG